MSQKERDSEDRAVLGEEDRRVLPATSLSLIRDAAGSGARRGAALERFARRYRRPVYRFFRKLARGDDVAKDYTQKFFAAKVLTGKLFATFDASAERGFRPYLKKALSNFFVSEARRVNRENGSLEDADQPPSTHRAAEDAFFAAWARTLIDEALSVTREQCGAKQRSHFEIFCRRYLGHSSDVSWASLGERFRIDAEQARTRATTVRDRFGRVLRALIEEALEPGESVATLVTGLLVTDFESDPDVEFGTVVRFTDDNLRSLLRLAEESSTRVPTALASITAIRESLEASIAEHGGASLLGAATHARTKLSDLREVKRRAKALVETAPDEETRAAAGVLYHTSVANALVHYGTNISSRPPRQRHDLFTALAHKFDGTELGGLFDQAAEAVVE